MSTQQIINSWENGVEPYTKWDDPVYWKGVRIGQCTNCKRQDKDVTRDGLCWVYEGELKPWMHFPTS